MAQWIRIAAVFAGVFAVFNQSLYAQQRVPIRGRVQINGRIIGIGPLNRGIQIGGEAGELANVDGVFLPPDRNAKRRLDSAKELIAEKRYGEAVRYLGSLLEAPEDFFFRPDPAQNVYRSLKAEAGRLIGELPKEGRESYELQFGARAQAMLNEALESGNIDAVAEVSRRFFYTQAGGEATFLLGKHFWDQGTPLAAAICFDRLRGSAETSKFEPMLSLLNATCWIQAGDDERAKVILLELKENLPSQNVTIAGREVKLFSNEGQSLAWLEEQIGPLQEELSGGVSEWAVHRGDAARNAASAGDLPLLNPRWRVQCADDPQVAEAVQKLERAFREENAPAIPSAFPLAVGDTILMRTTRSLMAIDFATGKRIWEPSTSFRGEETIDRIAINPDRQQLGVPAELLTAISERVWSDAPFGLLSSDGTNVYAIEDLAFAVNQNSRPRRVVAMNGRSRQVNDGLTTSNRLIALELKSEGKLRWEVGGEDGEDEPKLSGAFFLGAPLPVMGRLYVIAEMKGQEIRLIALSSETGKLEWSQQLAVVEGNILNDSNRRQAGATPSFADGVLVCPTSSGAVVAIDLAMRSLLWGFQYPRPSGEEHMDRLRLARARAYGQNERDSHDAWADATPTLAGGKVLITPVEADALYCLNLIDGSVAWKQDRGSNLYVGGIAGDLAVLVGRATIAGVDLADGKTRWQTPFNSAGSASPSGRGFISDNSYFVPLSTAEVAQVDLKTGKIVSRARSRRGEVPGNLICYRGEVLSQGTNYLECFYQLDALKAEVAARLKENPNDAVALVRLGEISFDGGDIDDAAIQFRRAYEISPEDATADLLAECLLAGLEKDFEKYRKHTDELEKLVNHNAQWTTYLRALAEGTRAAGKHLESLDACLRLADLDDKSQAASGPGAIRGARDRRAVLQGLDAISEVQWVARDRWLRTRIELLRKSADAETVAQIEEKIAARIATAIASNDADQMRRWIEIGGSAAAVSDCQLALVSTLGGPETLLERERILRTLVDKKDFDRRGTVVARLAKTYAEAKQSDRAALLCKTLLNEFEDLAVIDEKTGAEIVKELAIEPTGDLQASMRSWPAGNITARTDKPKRTLTANRARRAVDLMWAGNPGEFFAGANISSDPQQQQLLCVDKLGNEKFRLSTAEPNQRNRVMYFSNPQMSTVSADGPILFYTNGSQLTAYDGLRAIPSGTKPLWTQQVSDPLSGFSQTPNIHQQMLNIAWGENRLTAHDAQGKPIGSMVAVTPEGVLLQRGHEIYCLNALSGETIWQRKNVPPGCDFFGDEGILIATPSDGNEALVLNALDGELIAKCKVPSIEQRMTTIGRQVLVWRADGGRSTMTLVDPWKSDTLWTHHFAPQSRATVVGHDVVGVMEPSGKFSLFKIKSGERVIYEQLASEKTLANIYLFVSESQYLLVTNTPPVNMDRQTPIQPAPGGLYNPLINGRVYAFDRSTNKSLWPLPVKITNHGMVLSQPTELPVLVFMRSLYRATNGTHQPTASVLVIDKRTGRVAFKDDKIPLAIHNAEFSGDLADKTVSIMLPGRTITLTCTDEAWPTVAPEPVKKQPEGGEVGRAIGGIFRAIDNAARKISGLPTAEQEADPFGEDPFEVAPEAPQPQDEEAVEKQAEEKPAEKPAEKPVAEPADQTDS